MKEAADTARIRARPNQRAVLLPPLFPDIHKLSSQCHCKAVQMIYQQCCGCGRRTRREFERGRTAVCCCRHYLDSLFHDYILTYQMVS